jgi:hypothetical protein
MKWKIGILYGFLVWLIPFLISYAIYPLKTSNNPLFETIMPLVLVLIGSIFLYLYYKKDTEYSYLKGLEIGLIFFAVSIIVDLCLFMEGPMKMSFTNYMIDIGLTYLIYPIISLFYISNIKLKEN